MRIRSVLPLAAAVVLAAPVAAQTGQGTYTIVSLGLDTASMAGDTVTLLNHYRMVTLASAPSFPIHNVKNDCVGMLRTTGNAVASASGSCFAQSIDGAGYTMWWEMSEGGTGACPDICGRWGVYGGYGRFAGISGGGTWKRDGLFADGTSSGTWTGTMSMKSK